MASVDENDQQQQSLDTGTGDDEVLFTHTQQIVRTFVPIISGTLSVIGSITLLCIIISETKDQPSEQRRRRQNINSGYCSVDDERRVSRMTQKRRQPSNESNNSDIPLQNQLRYPLSMFQRIMVGVAISGLLVGLRATTSSFLLPADTVGVWKAFGNTKTCTMQGFFTQFSALLSMLYSASLAVFFYFSIVPYKNARIIKQRLEPVVHTGTILFATSTAFAGIFLDIYHPLPLGLSCWIAPAPCVDDDTEVECASVKKNDIIRMCFAGIPVALCLVTILFCMIAIYISVRRQKRKMEIHHDFRTSTSIDGNHASPSNKSRMTMGRQGARDNNLEIRLQKVSTQAALYISTFFIVHIWQVVGRRMESRDNVQGKFYMSVLSLFFYPLQGFLNFLIYIRPNFMQIRASDPNLSFVNVIKIVLRVDRRMEAGGEAQGPTLSHDITASIRTADNTKTIAEESSQFSQNKSVDQRGSILGLWSHSQKDLSNSSSSQVEIIVFDNTNLGNEKEVKMTSEEYKVPDSFENSDTVENPND